MIHLLKFMTNIIRYQIRPRFVRDTSHFDMRVTLLGEDINFPICVAPTGCQRFLHWEGEVATAKGINNGWQSLTIMGLVNRCGNN